MKLLYIANARIPTEKAHGIQIMKMCEAFSRLGHKVELVVPRRLNPVKEDPFTYYGIDKVFTITRIPTLDLVQFGRIGFWVQLIIFSGNAAWHTLTKNPDIIYTRDEVPAAETGFFRKNIIWETHGDRMNFFVKRALKKAKGVVAITKGIKDFYVEHGVASNNILVAHDGADVEMFSIKENREDARKSLSLPLDEKIVLYTGHFYEWKGAQVLADAARSFTDNQKAVFIGGTESDLMKFKKKNQNNKHIQILGHKSYVEMPLWMRAADILVLPNTKDVHTSPMKLFEYMASGTPIVASSLPSIREILNGGNSSLVRADSVEELGRSIKSIFKDKKEALEKATKAKEDALQYSWDKRAEKIIKFFEGQL